MNKDMALPRGQREIDVLPRFGLTKFAHRFPSKTEDMAIEIGGDVGQSVRLSIGLGGLKRVDQVSDFHCVTTWTKRNLSWSGLRDA